MVETMTDAIPNSAPELKAIADEARASGETADATRNRVYASPTPEQNERIMARLADMEYTQDEIDMICRVFTEEWLAT